MLSDDQVQAATKAFERVMWHYDGLNGSIIKWTLEHGNTNHDPSVCSWLLDPKGGELSRPEGALGSAGSYAKWLANHAKASFPLIDADQYPACRKEALNVAARKQLGKTTAKLRELLQDPDALTVQQVKELLAVVEAYAAFKEARIEELLNSDPLQAEGLLADLAGEFKGDAVGKRAQERLTALQKSERYQSEVVAAKALASLERMEDQFKAYRGKMDFGDAGFKEKNAALLGKARQVVKELVERWPESAAARKAKALAERWKLEG